MSEFIFYIIFVIAFGMLSYMLINYEYTEKSFAKKTKTKLIILTIIIALSGIVMVYDEEHTHNENIEQTQK